MGLQKAWQGLFPLSDVHTIFSITDILVLISNSAIEFGFNMI